MKEKKKQAEQRENGEHEKTGATAARASSLQIRADLVGCTKERLQHLVSHERQNIHCHIVSRRMNISGECNFEFARDAQILVACGLLAEQRRESQSLVRSTAHHVGWVDRGEDGVGRHQSVVLLSEHGVTDQIAAADAIGRFAQQFHRHHIVEQLTACISLLCELSLEFLIPRIGECMDCIGFHMRIIFSNEEWNDICIDKIQILPVADPVVFLARDRGRHRAEQLGNDVEGA